MEGPEHAIKILLLGDEQCGKSTFLSRISQGRHTLRGPVPIQMLRDMDQPFIFEVRSKKGRYRFEFYDTASPESWRLLHPDVVILCYDISQRSTLVNLQRVWVKEVKLTFSTSDTLPVLVLGLKRDLRREDDPNGVLLPQEGLCVAQEMRADRYMECSAVTGELLTEVFDDICLTAVKTTEGGGQSEGGCVIL